MCSRLYYLGLCKYTLWRSHNDEIAKRRISQKVPPSLSEACSIEQFNCWFVVIFNFRTIIFYSLFETFLFVCWRPNEKALPYFLSANSYAIIRPNTARTAQWSTVILIHIYCTNSCAPSQNGQATKLRKLLNNNKHAGLFFNTCFSIQRSL